MPTTAGHIRTINLVVVPVTDQDRAVEFYESIGFEKRTDIPFGNGYRWVEVYAAAGTTGIALVPPPPDGGPVGVQHLKALGADVDDEVSRMGDPVPPLFMFRDQDGNTLMVVQPAES
jgi:catechol 2,3-dioxygenase-like lactoylglutathione lyase family enzyme